MFHRALNSHLHRPYLGAAPDPNAQAWADAQKLALQHLSEALKNAPPFVHQDLSFFNPPADSRPFVVTPNPFPAYPAPGATPINIISYVVPVGLLAVINRIAIVHIGGNPPDGTGQVVWQVLINGSAVKGMHALTSQLGTYAQPNDFVILAIENDIVTVTAQVPAGQNPMPVGQSTAARFHGWTYPLINATFAKAATK